MCEMIGQTATLKEPYKGYTRIRIQRRSGYKWIVEICNSGLEIEVWEDEFELDE